MQEELQTSTAHVEESFDTATIRTWLLCRSHKKKSIVERNAGEVAFKYNLRRRHSKHVEKGASVR